ncbi:hypothetical protein [Streptomyces sp. NPDC020298]|uniref:hypothetical protein n=1 Tax=unclassified Streptomyces TaxID=2593676 RepID=UPI0033D3490E
MSTTRIRAARNARAALRPVERLVLLQLADFAGPDGVALIKRTASRTATGAAAPTAYRVIGGRA